MLMSANVNLADCRKTRLNITNQETRKIKKLLRNIIASQPAHNKRGKSDLFQYVIT